MNELNYKWQAELPCEQWPVKKKRLRARLPELLGQFPELEGDLKPVLLESCQMDGYRMDRVLYYAAEKLPVPAYVLIPDKRNEPAPAVIAWHGHGYGSKEVVGLRPDGTIDDGKWGIHQHFALELVKRGLIVIAPEVVGFGERRLNKDLRKDPMKNSSCAPLAARLMLGGRTLAGLRVQEAKRCVDYLLTRDDVDPKRIGTMGFSGGGLIAAFSAMIDERIQAAAISAYTSTFFGGVMSVGHCIDNYIPGMYKEGELFDWMGLIAPRALCVESGLKDSLFPVESVREAVHELSLIYEAEQASDQFAYHLFQGSHEVSGEKAYDWLAHKLGVSS